MLTREENELVTRVGPGTPMGDVMQRYWVPALMSRELPEPDCPPVRVGLLGERLVGFRPQFTVPAGVVEGAGEPGEQTDPLKQRPDELAAAPFFRSQRGRGGGVERLGADRLVEGPDRLAAVLSTGPGGHPQQPQPGGMASLVACREVTVVVDVGVDHAQRDEPPVHGVVALRGDLPDPFARHPGERAQRIEVEVDVGVVHGIRSPRYKDDAAACARR